MLLCTRACVRHELPRLKFWSPHPQIFNRASAPASTVHVYVNVKTDIVTFTETARMNAEPTPNNNTQMHAAQRMKLATN